MEDALGPASIPVRRELENRAISEGAAELRRAVEITGCVEDQASIGIDSVAAVKRMEDTLDPASISVRRELENRAPAPWAPPRGRRAVEVTGCVEDQAAIGISSVAAVKRMEYTLGPASISVRRELENRALIRGRRQSTSCRRDCRLRRRSGRHRDPAPSLRVKRMEDTLGPASISVRRELENRAISVGAAIERRAVEISGCVEDQASERELSVAAVKRMEDTLGPASISVRRELENRAKSMGAALTLWCRRDSRLRRRSGHHRERIRRRPCLNLCSVLCSAAPALLPRMRVSAMIAKNTMMILKTCFPCIGLSSLPEISVPVALPMATQNLLGSIEFPSYSEELRRKAKLTLNALVRVENANLGNVSWSPRATSLWPGRIRWSLGFAAARRAGSGGTRISELP